MAVSPNCSVLRAHACPTTVRRVRGIFDAVDAEPAECHSVGPACPSKSDPGSGSIVASLPLVSRLRCLMVRDAHFGGCSRAALLPARPTGRSWCRGSHCTGVLGFRQSFERIDLGCESVALTSFIFLQKPSQQPGMMGTTDYWWQWKSIFTQLIISLQQMYVKGGFSRAERGDIGWGRLRPRSSNGNKRD